VVVAEALACGVPVITTKGAPWEGLETHGCGWWVDIGAEPLAEALREAISLNDEERQAMGIRGRMLVEEKFAWPKIAAEMKSVYEWILGGGAPPSCVITD
jgi:glycosyltransferase involved in cell wall biosynthesis